MTDSKNITNIPQQGLVGVDVKLDIALLFPPGMNDTDITDEVITHAVRETLKGYFLDFLMNLPLLVAKFDREKRIVNLEMGKVEKEVVH